MSKRALIDRRAWLMSSILAAMAFVWLENSRMPGLYLLALKASPLLLLAIYALLRHQGNDTRLLAGMLTCEGVGSALIDYFVYQGTTLMIVGFGFGLGLFFVHRRQVMSSPQKALFVALIFMTPAIAYLLAAPDVRMMALFYGAAAGGMAASAWGSAFPRYRVGAGAVLIVGASLLAIGASTSFDFAANLGKVSWSLFFFGNLMLATGVTEQVRARS